MATVPNTTNGRKLMDTFLDPQWVADVAYVVETQCTAQKYLPAIKLTDAQALVCGGKVHPQEDGTYHLAGSGENIYVWVEGKGCSCPQATEKHTYCKHTCAVDIYRMVQQYRGKKQPGLGVPAAPEADWLGAPSPELEPSDDATDMVEDFRAPAYPPATALETRPVLSHATLEHQIAGWAKVRTLLAQYIKQHLKADVDFYTLKVGGRESKPTLSKSGAEKFLALLNLQASYRQDVETWEMLGRQPGLLCYICVLRTRSGEVVGEGRGARDVKKDGGDINKAIKMAAKSATVDAILRTGALSDAFTQDLEPEDDDVPTPTQPPALPPDQAKRRIMQLLKARGQDTTTRDAIQLAVLDLTGLALDERHFPEIVRRLEYYQGAKESA